MMKFLRIIGRVILVVIVLHMLAIAVVYIRNTLYLGGTKERNITYLEKNHLNLSDTAANDVELSSFFTEDFYACDIFFLGENHGFAKTQELDLLLLKHLNKEVGLRYYIAEMDSLRAHRLNLYLEADEHSKELLASVVTDIGHRIPQQSSVELFDKWKDIRMYNKTLPDSLKIKVIGIDKDFDDHRSEISRDSAMAVNFRNTVAKNGLGSEKFYGLFGYGHVIQAPYGKGGHRPLALRLKSSGIGRNFSVRSIVCYNLEGTVYFPENSQFPTPDDEKISILNDDGPITMVKGIKDVKSVAGENSITLFCLTGDASPYNNSQDLGGIKVNFFGNEVLPSDGDMPTTSIFQYIILVRNSKALTRMSKRNMDYYYQTNGIQ